jgi:glyceraldehyde 3-phosphate dehydrogenase
MHTQTIKNPDLPHSDLRRARAAAMNIIPTSTGAPERKLVITVWLWLDGYSAYRPDRFSDRLAVEGKSTTGPSPVFRVLRLVR